MSAADVSVEAAGCAVASPPGDGSAGAGSVVGGAGSVVAGGSAGGAGSAGAGGAESAGGAGSAGWVGSLAGGVEVSAGGGVVVVDPEPLVSPPLPPPLPLSVVGSAGVGGALSAEETTGPESAVGVATAPVTSVVDAERVGSPVGVKM
jgi:hypothetical protein